MILDTCNRLINKLIIATFEVLNIFLGHKCNVYMIHHVNNDNSIYSISKDNLDKFLSEFGNLVIPINQIFSSRKKIVLTIDDVSEDFYTNGYPLFMKYKIPFTLFVCIDLIDKLGYISRGQLVEMTSSTLCTLGSHGTAHEYFRKLNSDQRNCFLKNSKAGLESITNKEVDYFAFPYGSFYACGFKGIRIVKCYYKYGFSTIPISIATPRLLPKYFLPRINLTNSLCNRLISKRNAKS